MIDCKIGLEQSAARSCYRVSDVWNPQRTVKLLTFDEEREDMSKIDRTAPFMSSLKLVFLQHSAFLLECKLRRPEQPASEY